MESWMMIWLHCNRCGELPQKGGNDVRRFSLSFCGHVFCDQCVTKGARSCPICQHSPFFTEAINENLDPRLKALIMRPPLLYERVYQQLQDILDFQRVQVDICQELMQKKSEAPLDDVNECTGEDGTQTEADLENLTTKIAEAQRMLEDINERNERQMAQSGRSRGSKGTLNRTLPDVNARSAESSLNMTANGLSEINECILNEVLAKRSVQEAVKGRGVTKRPAALVLDTSTELDESALIPGLEDGRYQFPMTLKRSKFETGIDAYERRGVICASQNSTVEFEQTPREYLNKSANF